MWKIWDTENADNKALCDKAQYTKILDMCGQTDTKFLDMCGQTDTKFLDMCGRTDTKILDKKKWVTEEK